METDFSYCKTIYCEWNFLKAYSSKIDNLDIDFENIGELSFYKSLESLMLSKEVHIIFDINKDQFESDAKVSANRILKSKEEGKEDEILNFDLLLSKMDKLYYAGGWNPEFRGQIVSFDNMDKENPMSLNSIYLVDKERETCSMMMMKFGILVISVENIVDLLKYTNDNGAAIANKEKSDWYKVLKNKLPVCNSLIIVDNYILKDTNSFELNLERILDSCLPHCLKDGVKFHLTIVSPLKNNENMGGRYTSVKKILKHNQKLQNLGIELTVFKCEDVFHDRTIISNNFMISCGAGFDLFKNSGAMHSTTIGILCPFFNNSIAWAQKAYGNLIMELRKCWSKKKFDEYNKLTGSNIYIGSGINRLIDE